jgi:hypothetical protein
MHAHEHSPQHTPQVIEYKVRPHSSEQTEKMSERIGKLLREAGLDRNALREAELDRNVHEDNLDDESLDDLL